MNRLANGTRDALGGGDAAQMAGNVLSNVIAGAGGFLIGGATGAFTASNADLYNRSTGNGDGQGSTANSALGWIGDQLAGAGRGAENLANQFAALVNANGAQGSYVSPDDLNGPGGNSKPPAAGGSAALVPVCAVPPLCAAVPVVTPGMPGYVPSNATLQSGGDSSGQQEASSSAPVGISGSPMDVPRGTNSPTSINGTDYSGHAIDQMQSRGIPPSVVQNTIESGVTYPTRDGTTGYYDPKNNVRVVTNSKTGLVVTVIPGAP